MSDAAGPRAQGAGWSRSPAAQMCPHPGGESSPGSADRPGWDPGGLRDFAVPGLRTTDLKHNAIARLGTVYFFFFLVGHANNACKGVASLSVASCGNPGLGRLSGRCGPDPALLPKGFCLWPWRQQGWSRARSSAPMDAGLAPDRPRALPVLGEQKKTQIYLQ